MPHNIICVVLDDTDPDAYEAGAFPYLQTDPHDKWVRFPNAVISTPVCYAARCTHMTGQRADRNGGDIADFTQWGPPAFDEAQALFARLAAAPASYLSVGAIGKYLNNYPWTVAPWNEPAAYVPPGLDWMRLEHNSANEYYDWDHIDQTLAVTAHGATGADYRTDVEAQFCLDFLAQATEPFFLLWCPLAGHGPATPPPAYTSDPVTDPRTGLGAADPANDPATFNAADVTGKPGYITALTQFSAADATTRREWRRDMYRTLLAVDDGIEGIFNWLQANNHLSDTVVMVLSDNGFSNGRFRLQAGDQGKRHPYRFSTDLMLRVYHPDLTHAGHRVDTRLVTSADLAATIADIAGATHTITQDGRSFLPLILNTPGTSWRTGIELAGFNETGAGLSSGEAPPWWAFRTERWKYIWWPDQTGNGGGEHEELYDLDADPDEQTNVAGSNASTVAWLKARLRFARSVSDGARTAHF